MSTEVNLVTRGSPYRRLFDTSVLAAASAFVSGGLAPRAFSNPFIPAANLAVIDLRHTSAPGGAVPMSIMLQPFGTDASNEAFSLRVYGISEGMGLVGSTATKSWQPTFLAELLCTLGSAAGVAGTLVESTDFYCDTVAITEGLTDVVKVLSPEGDLRGAWAWIDHLSFDQIAIETEDGSSAAACNALYRFLW